MANKNPIRCEWCGKFIAYAEIDSGEATCKWEPDSHFGPERSEWSCGACNKKTKE